MLSKIFRKAALVISVAAITGCEYNNRPAPAGNLTKGEDSLVECIFGDEVNTAYVRKHLDPNFHGNTMAETSEDDIIFYKNWHESDYSKADVVDFALFMHEVTHIWQHQNSSMRNGHEGYRYSLSEQLLFDDYGIEQQASIIQDYVGLFLHKEHEPFRMDWTEEDYPLLQKVVEDKFPNARVSRLAFESREKQIMTPETKTARPASTCHCPRH